MKVEVNVVVCALYNGEPRKGKPIHYTSETPEPSGSRSIVHGRKRAARTFDFGEVDADEINHFIRTVVVSGDLVTFTLTSDQGALCTCVISGGLRHKTYATSGADAIAGWSELLEALY